MENKQISRSFKLLAQLMELHDENPFRIRSIAGAAFKIDKLPYRLADRSSSEIEEIPGIGKSLSVKITELLIEGTTSELNTLLQNTPDGIIEMMGIKGLGPKKISVIWKVLGIENLGELYYACNENRLVEAKGFGLKTQEEISKMIEFRMAANGKMIYSKSSPFANDLFGKLASWLNQFPDEPLLGLAGDYRRGLEVVEQLDYIIGAHKTETGAALALFEHLKFACVTDALYTATLTEGLAVNLHLCEKEEFYLQYFKLTGNEKHTASVLALAGNGPFSSEEDIYKAAGMQFIVPELREGNNEISLAQTNRIPDLITFRDLRGSLHNHSTWSDGGNTIEEMALFCINGLNLEYFGISDHSKSAAYAGGLKEEQILQQHAEIDKLNEKLSPFRIFKGIESDILGDGSLDYSEDVLKTFDFVVASIHSNLKMTEEKATSRLIKAIENPYTTILGHPTGRLLLSREGYRIDFMKVIDACAANGVIIEINANPLRLDLDWRWQKYAIEKGVLLSINPDAHRVNGFFDMHHGVQSARKGGLTPEKCLNAWPLEKVRAYFKSKG